MEDNGLKTNNPRRQFLGTIATGMAAVGLSALASPLTAHAKVDLSDPNELEDWFKQITGKHRIVFDSPQPNGIFPFAWPRIFLVTNGMTGTAEKDLSAVVVLRHTSIPYALDSKLWAKYKLGEIFKIDDPKTKKPATRNPFWKPGKEDFKVPGLGYVQIGINELQESGVLFSACNMALIVYSGVVAETLKLDPEVVKKDWMENVLPGIKVLPSGIWAINRAQEHGCSYVFTG